MAKKRKFDPIAVLRSIAEDENAPSTARVQACRALLMADARAEKGGSDPKATPDDRVTKSALRLLKGGKNG